MNWSYNNKFLKKIRISNLLNIIPILKKSQILEMNINNLGELKLEETNDQTISIKTNES